MVDFFRTQISAPTLRSAPTPSHLPSVPHPHFRTQLSAPTLRSAPAPPHPPSIPHLHFRTSLSCFDLIKFHRCNLCDCDRISSGRNAANVASYFTCASVISLPSSRLYKSLAHIVFHFPSLISPIHVKNTLLLLLLLLLSLLP